MVRPSPHRRALRLFDEYINHYVENANIETLLMYTLTDAAEVVIQQLSLSHLDLALHSPDPVPWKTRFINLQHGNLPYFCREYMAAERVSQSCKLLELFYYTVASNNRAVERYHSRLNMFQESWFVPFEVAIFKGVAEKDDAQKTRIVENYLDFLKRCSIYPSHRFDDIMPTLLEVCTSLDFSLTKKVLDIFCDSRIPKMQLFNLVPNGKCLERLLLQARGKGFKFWGLWTGKNDLMLNFLEMNPEKSKVLLQYAFPYATAQEASWRHSQIMNIRVEGRKIIQSIDVFKLPVDAEKRTRTMLIWDIFITFGKFPGRASFNDRVNTLLYLTRALPLPYVTPTEMKNTMLRTVITDFEMDMKKIAEEYGNAKIFEDDVNSLMPRRLMQSCRVVIKRRLADNSLYLDGIDQLRIPERLKEYLKLER